MPSKSQTYKLDYFKRGSYYSSESDLHRFLTFDYGLKSYIVDPDANSDPGDMSTYNNKILIKNSRPPQMQDFIKAKLNSK